MKEFNKKALMDLVNSRVKGVKNTDSKFITIQDSHDDESSTSNSKFSKSKINHDKIRGAMTSQKLSYFNLSKLIDTTLSK